MEKLIEKWLIYAKADLEAAEILAKSPKSNYSGQLAVLHCHQAIEKILKTSIVANGREPKKVHNLIFLLQESRLNPPKRFSDYIEELNPHYQPSRYPDIGYKGAILKYSDKITGHHLAMTKEVFQWIEERLTQKK